jgi:thiamine pyrophosphokinase
MKRGIIFLAGDFEALPREFLLSSNDFIVAADGGYQHLIRLGIQPNLLIGDFDSLPSALRDRAIQEGIPIITWPRDKDQTDGEIALREAINHDCNHLVFFGSWGGQRVDHSMANLMLLDLCEQLCVRAVLHHRGENILRLSPGSYEISGEMNQMVSLIPKSKEVVGIKTSGLLYPLSKENLSLGQTRGMSNRFSETEAQIQFETGELWLIWRGILPNWDKN